jgi:glycosyltransferase involved in cell wall biosynthesis
VVRKAAAVTVVSKSLLNDLSRYLPESDLPAVPITPMGVDCQHFCPRAPAENPRQTSQNSVKTILFVGRLAEKKGLEVLLRAMAEPALRKKCYQLTVVGDGPHRKRLTRLRRDLGLADRVMFRGAIPHKDLAQIYNSADILCVPSVVASTGDAEGLPTVILEGAASGLPVVATDVGGIRDFLCHGKNGVIVEPNRPTELAGALRALLSDPERCRSLGQAAREASLQFDWTIVANRFSSVLEKAASRTSRMAC